MNTSEPTTAVMLTLWHKERRGTWTAVSSNQSSGQLLALLKELPSGESIILPMGEHPDDSRRKRR